MMYFTRAVLNRQAGFGSIVPLLNPDDPNLALDAHHRLIWSLFPDKQASRDFLWRSDSKGSFYILSRRKPVQSDIFQPLECKEFAPALTQGDRLAFVLRANATKTLRNKSRNNQRRGLRVDLVMDAIYSISGQMVLTLDQLSDRPVKRMKIADHVAGGWLASIGERVGFNIEQFQVDNYSVRKLSRSKGENVTIGVLDMMGVILVERPEPFITALIKGFGRAKAFGCGLMLVRRV